MTDQDTVNQGVELPTTAPEANGAPKGHPIVEAARELVRAEGEHTLALIQVTAAQVKFSEAETNLELARREMKRLADPMIQDGPRPGRPKGSHAHATIADRVLAAMRGKGGMRPKDIAVASGVKQIGVYLSDLRNKGKVRRLRVGVWAEVA